MTEQIATTDNDNSVAKTASRSVYKLEEHSYRLLDSEPFFTAISRAVTKIRTFNIPTAGVCVNPRTGWFEMHYNPDFFDSLGVADEHGNLLKTKAEIAARREKEIIGVMKHEFYHLIFEHVTSRLPFDKTDKSPKTQRLALLWNVAADLAINSHIYKELPFFCCVPGRVYIDPKTKKADHKFEKYPLGLAAEAYYELLKKEDQENKNGEGGEGEGIPGQFDSHDQWAGEGNEQGADPVLREIAKERLKDSLRQAATEAVSGGGWGSVTATMQKEIVARLQKTIDWRAVLLYFIKTSLKADRSSSMRKINRRYPYIQAGRKTSRIARLAISIDQSGSVSDQMLEAFFAELNSLSDLSSFTVVPFDDQVYEEKVYVWKKGEHRPRERVLCGGTNFDAPTEYVNKGNFDGHIILTDLCAPKPIPSKCQRMWITTESCAKSPYFATDEKIVAISEKDIAKFDK